MTIVGLIISSFVIAAPTVCAAEQAKAANVEPKPLSAKDAYTRAFDSMVRGDVEGVRAGMYAADEQSQKILGWFEEITTAAADGRRAVMAKFGEGAKKQLDASSNTFSKKDQKRILEKVEGDTATIWVGGDPKTDDPAFMRKVDGVWKLDIARMLAQEDWKPENLAKESTNSVKRLARFKSKLEDGEFKTAQKAANALRSAVLDSDEESQEQDKGL